MVPLPNVKHISLDGSFTVLTYNILADLYATVRHESDQMQAVC
jgi:mRNA deadenylase 3'-5' endonuclease subunit Ccr4